jgi:myo-inositol-1(or 4)-monophosphatase
MVNAESAPRVSKDPRDLAGRATEFVVEAGDHARTRWGAVNAETKADSSLVTDVDREVEAFLYDRLRVLDPAASFAGEEAGMRSPASSDLTWICDPVDGTTNFVAGLPHWCVSLGLLAGNEAIVGVVYAPALGLLYQASAGHGATRNGASIRSARTRVLHHEDLLCLSKNAL